MVRSDLGASGVMFTLDTDPVSPGRVHHRGYGLGETVVQGAGQSGRVLRLQAGVARRASMRSCGAISARKAHASMMFTRLARGRQIGADDRCARSRAAQVLASPTRDVEELARHALTIEEHYERPMDIEWGKDGVDGKLYILQARPETVKSRARSTRCSAIALEAALGGARDRAAHRPAHRRGPVRAHPDAARWHRVQAGDVLVADMTDPDWEPVMKRAAAIVTNRGGRTCHAAIIARELGMPAVVGCGDATQRIARRPARSPCPAPKATPASFTTACSSSRSSTVELDAMPQGAVKIMMNVGNPERAFDFQRLPNDGVGLARLEFIIARMIGVHPKAVLAYPDLPARPAAIAVEQHAPAMRTRSTFYVEKLAEGVAHIAAAFCAASR